MDGYYLIAFQKSYWFFFSPELWSHDRFPLPSPNIRIMVKFLFPDYIESALQVNSELTPRKDCSLEGSLLIALHRLQCQLSSVQSLSHVQLFVNPWTAERQASLSITNSWNLLKLVFIELVMPSNHLILCCPLLLLSLIFPNFRVFSNESVLRIRWPKYWSFSFSISTSSEHPGLISFRMDWLDLLGVQGTLKSLLQHHSSKASILWCSAFFIVQLSHPYMTTGKTIALTRWNCWQSNISAF